MNWSTYIASFFAGMFLANCVPHFVKGICGDRFPTPFAKPPGRGLSSAPVNVVWALFNLLVGSLLFHTAGLSNGNVITWLIFFIGFASLSILVSNHFTKKHAD